MLYFKILIEFRENRVYNLTKAGISMSHDNAQC